jgi:hypothetical protein
MEALAIVPQVVCGCCSEPVAPEGGEWCKAHLEEFRPKHLVKRSPLVTILRATLRKEGGK